MFSVLKIIKNWHFLTPLPPTGDYVIYEWSPINCVCPSIRAIFRVLGIYNFDEHVNCFLPPDFVVFFLILALLLRTFEDSHCTYINLTKFLPQIKVSKVQRADLTCDGIKKVAPFVLSKLWILVADWSMHWSRDTFLIKLRLYWRLCLDFAKHCFKIKSNFK